MNILDLLKDAATIGNKKPLPILSFPAAQKLNVTVEELVKDSELQAKAIETVASQTDTIAAISLMDLSVEAEAFGAEVGWDGKTRTVLITTQDQEMKAMW